MRSQCTSLFKRLLSTHVNKSPQKVVVAMSGGVDSSVSAALLKQQGYKVEGIYMRNWDTSDERGVCTSREDWEDVQKTLDDYAHGFTPNPDIACNSFIKFGALLDKIPKDALFATGHYCRFEKDGKLLRGLERNKDQSYYLSTVPEEALKRTLFPLGNVKSKVEVKKLAKKFADFLEQYIDQPPGPVIDLDSGKVIGQHNGLFGYTIGQASRICHGSDKWFVAQKILNENKLVCVAGSNHSALFANNCVARDWVWIHHQPPEKLSIHGEMIVDAQVRYRQSPEKAILSRLENGQYSVRFNNPIRAIACGQQVVVWDGDWCLGGGVIHDVF
ncbi:unnamed protein product [Mucor hiemalis]